jgi:RES domain-containing protein
MILWRISNYADLLGTGGLYASGRWHTRGKPVLYLAESSSSALLETLIHLEVDEDHRPATHRLLKVEADDTITFERIELASLPVEWRTSETITQRVGDEWLQRAGTALLRVPSAIAPETWNWVLNPRHSNASHVRILTADSHRYDWRLLGRH